MNLIKKYVRTKIVVVPSEDTKTLEFNQYQKSDIAPFIIYADLECLIENVNACKNNPEKSSTTTVDRHVPSGFSLSTISSFKSIENRNVVCRDIESREHAMEIINFKNEKMKSSTNEQQISYQNANTFYISTEKSADKHPRDKKYCKTRVHCHHTRECGGAAHEIFSKLKYSVPKEIHIFFHNRSYYDYHFIIKELAEEFEMIIKFK